jgi:hypothetical protein
METMINPYKTLSGKPERTRTLGRLRNRWEGTKVLQFVLQELGVRM